MFLNYSRNPKSNLKFGLFLIVLLCLPFFASGAIHFTDVSALLQVRGYSYFGGHGVCWVDVNGDGRLDLFIKNNGAQGISAVPDILYINHGAYFTDEAAERGAADAYPDGTHGAVFSDFDKDSDFDLFSSTTYVGVDTAHNHLYRNDGNGYFQDITASAIVPPQSVNVTTRGVAAADFDRDGDIDFYISNALPDPDPTNPYPSPPQALPNFYVNNGFGIFTPEYRGIDWTGFVQGVSAVDVDGDGDIDIAEAKWGPPSTIYINDGRGYFQDIGGSWGLSTASGVKDNGMTFGDVDNDGDLDLAIAGGIRVFLFRYQDRHYKPYQIIRVSRGNVFHACYGDFDNDGFLELYVSGESVYETDGEGHFKLIPNSESGLENSRAARDPRGSALGDIDGDGDLDIYVTDKRNYNLLFRNDLNNADWIEVEIVGDPTGTAGNIGTKLDLYLAGHLDDKAFLKGHREIQGEYGYLGQDMPTVHFGAPAAEGARYDLKVTFPNGSVKTFANLSPGQKIYVSSLSPPLNFRCVKVENKTLFYRETLIELTWEPNPDNTDVAAYRIYEVSQGRDLLAEVPGNQFSYMMRDVDKTRAYYFAITAVDGAGHESGPAYSTTNGNATQRESQRLRLQKEIITTTR